MKNHDFQKGKMAVVRRFLNNFQMFYGGDLMKNDDFKKGKWSRFCVFFEMLVDAFFDGGDATENDDFHRRKQRLQGSIFSFGDNFQKVKQRLHGLNEGVRLRWKYCFAF